MQNTSNPSQPNFFVESFGDIKILRYTVSHFEEMELNRKLLIYYLSRASLAGRDIIYDQNYKYNLLIRKTLEAIYENYSGDREHPQFKKFLVYLKTLWYNNGIHHHFSKEKNMPEFTQDYFAHLIWETGIYNLQHLFDSLEEAVAKLKPLLFDENVAPKAMEQDAAKDMIQHSANNFYEGVTQKESEDYYARLKEQDDKLSWGLNSRLEKENGTLVEKTWKEGGLYGGAISEIIRWLEKALDYAETQQQSQWLKALIEYYRTGDLQKFDEYNLQWVQDTSSTVDLINGFIETYEDPLGLKGTWESILHVQNPQATERTRLLSRNAQWFEDHAPIDDRFKKSSVKGVSASVVEVAMLGGESYPTTPIGVNLPNADWIRKEHGSKSITLNNISRAHHEAMMESGFLEEFAFNSEEVERSKKYGFEGNNLHTDLHECLGHGSGQLLEGVSGDALKNFGSPIEEARADLFALYYMMDQKMIELGVASTLETARAQYDGYIRNGMMTQLTRVKPGKNLEQAHMRNRQLIARWCFEKGAGSLDDGGSVIESWQEDGRTYFVINDYERLRELFGELLTEIQRIKSEGDYQAARELVRKYGSRVDRELHQEVLERFKKLNIAPFTGFINPVYEPVEENGEIVDVRIRYDEGYSEQMMRYGREYSYLPASGG